MRVKTVLALGLVFLMVAGCAATTLQWNKLSSDEKARVLCDQFQEQLVNLFDQGQAYVASHPEALEIWKGKALPAFSLANKALGVYIASNTKTVNQIMADIPKLIQDVLLILQSMGVPLET